MRNGNPDDRSFCLGLSKNENQPFLMNTFIDIIHQLHINNCTDESVL